MLDYLWQHLVGVETKPKVCVENNGKNICLIGSFPMVILQRSPCAGFAANELSVIEASATGSAGFLGPGFTAGYEAGAAAVRMFSVRRRPADPAETLCASQKSAGFRKSVTQ